MRRIALTVVLVTALAVALTPLAHAEGPESAFPAAEQRCEAQGGNFVPINSSYGCLVTTDGLNLSGTEVICRQAFGGRLYIFPGNYLCIISAS